MKKILLSLVLLSFGLCAISLHGQVLAGTRKQVEVLSRLMPQSQGRRGMSVPRPEGYAGGPLVVLRNEAAGYLLIGARDLETLKKAPADKEAGQGLLWITKGLAQAPTAELVSTGDFSASFGDFRYSRSGARCWTDQEIIDLLVAADAWFGAFFGSDPNDLVRVTDQDGGYYPGTRADKPPAIMKRAGGRGVEIDIYLPPGYGAYLAERDMAKHFFTHELLHSWYYPWRGSDDVYAEPLTQYLTRRFLLEKGYVAGLSFDEDVRRRKASAAAGSEIDRYFLLFDEFRARDPAACDAFLREAAWTLAKRGNHTARLFERTFGDAGKPRRD
ncbi:MAG: hypothetical protein JNG85_08865 [Spirochaetaceae bacterium]|nr:hypothetical protein [Spirochaetaceae bacterium]